MKMPFRDDLSALETRRETLQAELAQVQEQKRQLAGLEAREKQLQQSLEATEAVLDGMGRRGASGGKRSLLDNVSIASPCPASWDNMQGNGRVRFCLQCEKNVYNLAAMPREEAEELIQARGDACVRLYRRVDGTVMTADCPVGMKIRRAKQRKFALLGIGAAVFSSGLASALAARISCPGVSPMDMEMDGHFVAGKMSAPPLATPPTITPDETEQVHVFQGRTGLRPSQSIDPLNPEKPTGHHMMGAPVPIDRRHP